MNLLSKVKCIFSFDFLHCCNLERINKVGLIKILFINGREMDKDLITFKLTQIYLNKRIMIDIKIYIINIR